VSKIQHTTLSSGDRLDRYLAANQLCTSRSEAARWIEDQRVLINGQPQKAAYIIQAGDEIVVDKPEIKLTDLVPKKIDFEILHEDADLLVLNKPAGIAVHPGAGNYEETLVHGLLHHCKDLSGIGGVSRPGIVHRLDKGTTGLMVVAKNDRAHQALTEQFQAHTVEKEYRALTVGKIAKPQQTLVNLMKRSELNRKKFVVNLKKGKEAITHVTLLKGNTRVSLVAAKIDTGRTHQIRVHLSFIGHPILGDETYGGTKKLTSFSEEERAFVRGLARPLLHSYRLAFTHPRSKKKMVFTSEIPDDFKLAVEKFL
jgi:23S rRNA pseudouridine1911/1915/1917 synthase